jgi:hypothetical protein
MKVKKESIILAALIIALSLYLYFRQQDKTQYELPVLEEVAVSQITKVEISKAKSPAILLEREGDGWILAPGEYPADSVKVAAILEALSKLTLSALISESKSYERYGLGKEDSIGVKAWTKQGLKRDFELGREAPSFQHTFVRIGGDDRVFHARENLKVRFDQSVDDLRDKSVLALEISDLDEIGLNDGKATLLLTRKQNFSGESDKDGSWESSEGVVDDTVVADLLSALSNLKCRTFLYGRKKADFKNPVYAVTVKGVEEHSLALYAKEEMKPNDYPALSSQNESPFLLSEHQAERIMLPFERIVKP